MTPIDTLAVAAELLAGLGLVAVPLFAARERRRGCVAAYFLVLAAARLTRAAWPQGPYLLRWETLYATATLVLGWSLCRPAAAAGVGPAPPPRVGPGERPDAAHRDGLRVERALGDARRLNAEMVLGLKSAAEALENQEWTNDKVIALAELRRLLAIQASGPGGGRTDA